MPFSEKTKLLAKTNAAFRCCVCHAPFVEVHHILPESQGGTSSIENAAPLCASCHDLYGGNPEKRKALRQMRDDWCRKMAARSKRLTELSDFTSFEISEESGGVGGLRRMGVTLYHRVYQSEGFEQAANHLLGLVHAAQKNNANQKRFLFLDIDGHRTKRGRFDRDMHELQLQFLNDFLIQYVCEIHAPMVRLRNRHLQDNVVPEGLRVYERLDAKAIENAVQEGIHEIWSGQHNVMVRIEKNATKTARIAKDRNRKSARASE